MTKNLIIIIVISLSSLSGYNDPFIGNVKPQINTMVEANIPITGTIATHIEPRPIFTLIRPTQGAVYVQISEVSGYGNLQPSYKYLGTIFEVYTSPTGWSFTSTFSFTPPTPSMFNLKFKIELVSSFGDVIDSYV